MRIGRHATELSLYGGHLFIDFIGEDLIQSEPEIVVVSDVNIRDNVK
jgi:hypothetical protein